MIDIYEMVAILSIFFIMADTDISFLLALEKPEMQTFCWFSFLNFPLVYFSLSPYACTFVCGDLSALVKSAKRICQNSSYIYV